MERRTDEWQDLIINWNGDLLGLLFFSLLEGSKITKSSLVSRTII